MTIASLCVGLDMLQYIADYALQLWPSLGMDCDSQIQNFCVEIDPMKRSLLLARKHKRLQVDHVFGDMCFLGKPCFDFKTGRFVRPGALEIVVCGFSWQDLSAFNNHRIASHSTSKMGSMVYRQKLLTGCLS